MEGVLWREYNGGSIMEGVLWRKYYGGSIMEKYYGVSIIHRVSSMEGVFRILILKKRSWLSFQILKFGY